MRKLNEIITRISVWILKKIRWENTEFNQQTISTILGWTFGFILACIFTDYFGGLRGFIRI